MFTIPPQNDKTNEHRTRNCKPEDYRWKLRRAGQTPHALTHWPLCPTIMATNQADAKLPPICRKIPVPPPCSETMHSSGMLHNCLIPTPTPATTTAPPASPFNALVCNAENSPLPVPILGHPLLRPLVPCFHPGLSELRVSFYIHLRVPQFMVSFINASFPPFGGWVGCSAAREGSPGRVGPTLPSPTRPRNSLPSTRGGGWYLTIFATLFRHIYVLDKYIDIEYKYIHVCVYIWIHWLLRSFSPFLNSFIHLFIHSFSSCLHTKVE